LFCFCFSWLFCMYCRYILNFLCSMEHSLIHGRNVNFFSYYRFFRDFSFRLNNATVQFYSAIHLWERES
jgi:hypothetical protein